MLVPITEETILELKIKNLKNKLIFPELYSLAYNSVHRKGMLNITEEDI